MAWPLELGSVADPEHSGQSTGWSNLSWSCLSLLEALREGTGLERASTCWYLKLNETS